MKHIVRITTTIFEVGTDGRRREIFTRHVEDEDRLPGHLAQQELFMVTHNLLHPAKPNLRPELKS
ncbi:MAG: hypothetical protein KGL39_36740 [Patescibacteria group bacterium]|nr:hypothetical protein [Patescibacteria group bacterium]